MPLHALTYCRLCSKSILSALCIHGNGFCNGGRGLEIPNFCPARCILGKEKKLQKFFGYVYIHQGYFVHVHMWSSDLNWNWHQVAFISMDGLLNGPTGHRPCNYFKEMERDTKKHIEKQNCHRHKNNYEIRQWTTTDKKKTTLKRYKITERHKTPIGKYKTTIKRHQTTIWRYKTITKRHKTTIKKIQYNYKETFNNYMKIQNNYKET